MGIALFAFSLKIIPESRDLTGDPRHRALGFLLTRPRPALDQSSSALLLPFVIVGLGIGSVSAPMTSAVMASAPRPAQPAGFSPQCVNSVPCRASP